MQLIPKVLCRLSFLTICVLVFAASSFHKPTRPQMSKAEMTLFGADFRYVDDRTYLYLEHEDRPDLEGREIELVVFDNDHCDGDSEVVDVETESLEVAGDQLLSLSVIKDPLQLESMYDSYLNGGWRFSGFLREKGLLENGDCKIIGLENSRRILESHFFSFVAMKISDYPCLSSFQKGGDCPKWTTVHLVFDRDLSLEKIDQAIFLTDVDGEKLAVEYYLHGDSKRTITLVVETEALKGLDHLVFTDHLWAEDESNGLNLDVVFSTLVAVRFERGTE